MMYVSIQIQNLDTLDSVALTLIVVIAISKLITTMDGQTQHEMHLPFFLQNSKLIPITRGLYIISRVMFKI